MLYQRCLITLNNALSTMLNYIKQCFTNDTLITLNEDIHVHTRKVACLIPNQEAWSSNPSRTELFLEISAPPAPPANLAIMSTLTVGLHYRMRRRGRGLVIRMHMPRLRKLNL